MVERVINWYLHPLLSRSTHSTTPLYVFGGRHISDEVTGKPESGKDMPLKLLYSLIYLLLISLSVEGKKKVIIMEENTNQTALNEKTFLKENTIYKIKSAYSLGNRTLQVGKQSEIELDGGQLNEGAISLGNDCRVNGNNVRCDNLRCYINGKNIKLEKLNVSSSGSSVIWSYVDCDNLSITDCDINAINGNCIKLVADNIKGVIEKICISNCNFTFRRMGIEMQNHGNSDYRFNAIDINGCQFSQHAQDVKYGFAVSLSGYGKNVNIRSNLFNATTVGVELVGFSQATIFGNQFKDIANKIVVASNKRFMEDITIEQNKANSKKAKIQMSNATHVKITKNDLNLSMIEMTGCSECLISGNTIVSNGHYAIMLDGGKKNTSNNSISDNIIKQHGDNWAVLRCYGPHAKNNIFSGNNITRKNKKGVIFDQIKGATGNKNT